MPKITKFRKFRCYQNFCNCKLNQGVRKPNRTSERGDRTKLWFSKTTGSWDRTSTHVQTKAHMTSAWISKHHGSANEDMDAPCELAVELEEETTLTPPELREEKERSFGFLSFLWLLRAGSSRRCPFHRQQCILTKSTIHSGDQANRYQCQVACGARSVVLFLMTMTRMALIKWSLIKKRSCWACKYLKFWMVRLIIFVLYGRSSASSFIQQRDYRAQN